MEACRNSTLTPVTGGSREGPGFQPDHQMELQKRKPEAPSGVKSAGGEVTSELQGQGTLSSPGCRQAVQLDTSHPYGDFCLCIYLLICMEMITPVG